MSAAGGFECGHPLMENCRPTAEMQRALLLVPCQALLCGLNRIVRGSLAARLPLFHPKTSG